jgi:hypothetical protein
MAQVVDLAQKTWRQRCLDPDCREFRSDLRPVPETICPDPHPAPFKGAEDAPSAASQESQQQHVGSKGQEQGAHSEEAEKVWDAIGRTEKLGIDIWMESEGAEEAEAEAGVCDEASARGEAGVCDEASARGEAGVCDEASARGDMGGWHSE